MDNIKKELIGRTITRTFTVAKNVTINNANVDDITKAMSGDDENSLLAFASVEIPDSSNDVVRIDGIDVKSYHNPPTSHLKILAQHQQASAVTGETFVIGRVEQFVKTKTAVEGKQVPALAFRMTWASSDLAKSYKAMYDEGMLDSFSVGMRVEDYEAMDTGGYDFTKTSLMEISCVAVPANRLARVIKSIDAENRVEALEAKVDQLLELVTKMADFAAKSQLGIETTCELTHKVEGHVTSLMSKSAEQLQVLSDRLDAIECGIVVKSIVPNSHQTGDRKSDSTLMATKQIAEQLKKFAGK